MVDEWDAAKLKGEYLLDEVRKMEPAEGWYEGMVFSTARTRIHFVLRALNNSDCSPAFADKILNEVVSDLAMIKVLKKLE